MIFKVSEDYDGTFVLSSIGVILRAGKKICIEKNKILSPDVKMAIKNKILIPFDEECSKEYEEKYSNKSHEMMVMNRTDKILSIGDIILKPWVCLLVSKKDVTNNESFKNAEEKGYIAIISDDSNFNDIEKYNLDKNESNISGVNKINSKKNKDEKNEKDSTPVVWDFDKQKTKEAEKIEVTAQPRYVDEDEDKLEDGEKKVNKKKTTKKKATKKKATKKKTPNKKATKKKISKKKTVKKENKEIKPVGDKRVKTEEDIIELDSRGNPIDKPSDVLIDLIESVESEVSFVDEEQKMEKLKKIEDKSKRD